MPNPDLGPQVPVERFSDETRARFPDESFDAFEQEVAKWERRFLKAKGMAQFEEARLRETGEVTVRRQIGHLAASVAIRVVDLASGLIVLINTGHVHAAYATSRSIVETAAVPAYIVRNVLPHLVKGRAERVDGVLKRLTMGIDPGIYFERENVEPIKISQLVSSLCEEFQATPGIGGTTDDEPAGLTLRRMYSMLSDHTHPNYGAMHLSSAIEEDGMTWSRPLVWDQSELYDVEGTAYLAMWAGGLCMDRVLDAANDHRLVIKARL